MQFVEYSIINTTKLYYQWRTVLSMIGSSSFRSWVKVLPMRSWTFQAGQPWGWDTFIFKFFLSSCCPFGIEVAATTDLPNLAKQAFSHSKKDFCSMPKACSRTLISWTIRLNSSGISEQLWSLPFQLLSRVKCLSITLAPLAIAPSVGTYPISWPE